LLYFIVAAIGALLTARQLPISWLEAGQLVQPLWLNILVGVLGGAIITAVLHLVSMSVTKRVGDGEGIALLNGGFVGLIGALFGLLGYSVMALLFEPSLWLRVAQAGFIFFLTYIGFIIGFQRDNLLIAFVTGENQSGSSDQHVKLLDTSVIIDGRIQDLVKTGFLEGQVIIPQFVMDELQQIADSADALRRRRGRRGLDILSELRSELSSNFKVLDQDYPLFRAVDRKLIQLAKELSAVILTTDFNLNKVATVEGVSVYNINELANALKPRFIQGDDLEIEVVSPGEESDQGVGYLDDGTMVVVEHGRPYIGKKIHVTVSNVLQKEAGKMLFVRPKSEAGDLGPSHS
jgi:uncharacterized protein YacL